MSLGDVLNSLMREGLSPQTMDRLKTGARSAGDDMEQTLEKFVGPERMGQAKDFLNKEQTGGLSGAQIGGIGAAIGGLLGLGRGVGGAAGGAIRGGALAMLGTLAYMAYQQYQAEKAGGPAAAAAIPPPPDETVAAMGHADTEKLALRAMLMAAKSDGRVDQAEVETILARVGGDAATAEDRAFLEAEMTRPVDPAAIAAEVDRPEVAMEVYLAALLAIDVDHDGEKRFLRELGAALGLDPAATARLHAMTGAPAV
jgi:uncharacterized membrane protein YebE (DUF533 family)